MSFYNWQNEPSSSTGPNDHQHSSQAPDYSHSMQTESSSVAATEMPVSQQPVNQQPAGVMTVTIPVNITWISVHTAKCQVCNSKNAETLYRCTRCSWTICTPCLKRVNGSFHHTGCRFRFDDHSVIGPYSPIIRPTYEREQPTSLKAPRHRKIAKTPVNQKALQPKNSLGQTFGHTPETPLSAQFMQRPSTAYKISQSSKDISSQPAARVSDLPRSNAEIKDIQMTPKKGASYIPGDEYLYGTTPPKNYVVPVTSGDKLSRKMSGGGLPRSGTFKTTPDVGASKVISYRGLGLPTPKEAHGDDADMTEDEATYKVPQHKAGSPRVPHKQSQAAIKKPVNGPTFTEGQTPAVSQGQQPPVPQSNGMQQQAPSNLGAAEQVDWYMENGLAEINAANILVGLSKAAWGA
jgi:hypothetical protein